MTTAKMHVEGLRELHEQLRALGDAGTSKKIVRRALRAAVSPVVESARQMAPVDEGELRDSITLAAILPKSGRVFMAAGLKVGRRKVKDELPGDGDYAAATVTRVVDAGWRWHFPEFGTSRQAARPFIRPAWDRHKGALLGVFADELRRGIRRAIKQRRADQ